MNRAERNFVVPAYYSCFSCKGSNCRNTCCSSLSITVSLEEYRNLVGLPCPEDIRRDLDASFSLHQSADVYKYADMNPNFYGRCRMLDAEGLCRLQSACGETALPSVCRYFPRAVKFGPLPLCCCGNGCEKTLELLADPGAPDGFDRETLTFELPYEIPAADPDDLYRRKLSLLSAEMMTVSGKTLQRKLDLIARLIDDAEPAPEDSQVMMDELRIILDYASRQSETLAEYADAALRLDNYRNYDIIQYKVPDKICRAYPGFERFFCRVLANDILFRGFPFGDPKITPAQSFRVFHRMVYALLMLISANLGRLNGNDSAAEDPNGMNRLIDLFVHYFRLVELTDFDAAILALIGDGDNGNDNGTDNNTAA